MTLRPMSKEPRHARSFTENSDLDRLAYRFPRTDEGRHQALLVARTINPALSELEVREVHHLCSYAIFITSGRWSYNKIELVENIERVISVYKHLNTLVVGDMVDVLCETDNTHCRRANKNEHCDGFVNIYSMRSRFNQDFWLPCGISGQIIARPKTFGLLSDVTLMTHKGVRQVRATLVERIPGTGFSPNSDEVASDLR